MNSYPIVFGRILKGKNLEDVTEFDFLKSGLTLKGKNLEDAIESNFAKLQSFSTSATQPGIG